jgi:hypothetical protein
MPWSRGIPFGALHEFLAPIAPRAIGVIVTGTAPLRRPDRGRNRVPLVNRPAVRA